MGNYSKIEDHQVILSDISIRTALEKLDRLQAILLRNTTLFVISENQKLIGTVTDGDIRRGLIKGINIDDAIDQVMHAGFRYVTDSEVEPKIFQKFKDDGVSFLPVIDNKGKLLRIINVVETTSVVPVDAIIMAGGKGSRLKDLTKNTPKPLLRVGHRTILDYALERIVHFGINDIHIITNYLSEMIESHVKGSTFSRNRVKFYKETTPLGTAGGIRKIKKFANDSVLLLNSDVITTIDYGDFYNEFEKEKADMAVATIPYTVDIPYAVLETNSKGYISSIKEKPSITYYSNGGIYLIRKKVLEKIPVNTFFNATDLLNILLEEKYKVISYPMLAYWLDVGDINAYIKAQKDVLRLKL